MVPEKLSRLSKGQKGRHPLCHLRLLGVLDGKRRCIGEPCSYLYDNNYSNGAGCQCRQTSVPYFYQWARHPDPHEYPCRPVPESPVLNWGHGFRPATPHTKLALIEQEHRGGFQIGLVPRKNQSDAKHSAHTRHNGPTHSFDIVQDRSSSAPG